jgi:DNA-binding MarR family transcriptional regulator
MVRIRRRQTSRVLGRAANKDRATPVNLDQVAAVDAVDQGSVDAEVTVGDVAVRLGIDPSRASRVVAGAIGSGYLERYASQRDGRRICLRVTSAGREVIGHAHRARRDMIADLLTGWSAKDRADFARLLTRFTDAL